MFHMKLTNLTQKLSSIRSMNLQPHEVTSIVALLCVTALGVIYILNGGDGQALAGSLTAIGVVLGYLFGKQPPANPNV